MLHVSILGYTLLLNYLFQVKGYLVPVYNTIVLYPRSPERLENKEYSFSSDIWSLGIVIYEMATGEHPFQLSESAVEIQRFVE